MADPRRMLPRTDAVLADPRLSPLLQRHRREAVVAAVRTGLAEARAGTLAPDRIVHRVAELLPRLSLTPVVNATGVLVHTNLGRAPLDAAAVVAAVDAAGCTTVEFDVSTGRRGPRAPGVVRAVLDRLPGAGDALIVNNNAAALLLAVTALGPGGQVLVSRGELVEIGDGFRLPDLMASAGAVLQEVGTTNRTTLSDYTAALAEASCIVKIHPSNFVVTGFTEAVGIAELAATGVPVIADLGSGLLAPDPRLPHEPDATTALAAGAGLVLFSADKLLGGPQAGIIAGRAELVARLRRHPLARALRPGKITLAALEATLRAPEPPVLRMLREDASVVAQRAERLASLLAPRCGFTPAVTASLAVVGGGGAPGVELPSSAVELPALWAEALRQGSPAVVGRIERGRLLLDARTIADDQLELVVDAVAALSDRRSPG